MVFLYSLMRNVSAVRDVRDVRDASPKRALPPFATGGKTPFYTLRNQMSHIVQSFATGDKTICH
jgi:hypothetical protein